MITERSAEPPTQLHRLAPPSPSVHIHLPAAIWVAKLTTGDDPEALLSLGSNGVPSHWMPSPLATGRTYGGILSAADVGNGIQPNLSPTASLPLPGDRIIITRTGRRVEVFGAVEITGLTVNRCGALRIGHRPLVKFTEPVDLRQGRRHNELLDTHWDQLFGRPARDRRLVPLSDGAVALTFAAFGFSLEQLFAHPPDRDTGTISPAPPWNLDAQITAVSIRSQLSARRIANSVAVFHGVDHVFDTHPSHTIEITGNRSGRDLLLSVTEDDHTHFVVAVGLSRGESYRINPAYRQLIETGVAATVLAMEGEQNWNIFNLEAHECVALQQIENEQLDRRN